MNKALILYSVFYGAVPINILDIAMYGFHGWHLFLISLYIYPFFLIPLLKGLHYLNQCFALALLTSLSNDLTYAFMKNILIDDRYDLLSWYKFQLGLDGLNVHWTADFLLFQIPVSSLLIGISIYARILILAFLLSK